MPWSWSLSRSGRHGRYVVTREKEWAVESTFSIFLSRGQVFD